jgi:hypothetical protein
MTIDGDVQNGPTLRDVLAASAVGEWSTVVVVGLGPARAFEVAESFARADVNDTWILDVTNRGTLKLAAEGLSRERWVRDIREVRVR